MVAKSSDTFALTLRDKDVSLEQWQDISEVLIDGIPEDDPDRNLPLHKYLALKYELSLRQVLVILTHPDFCTYLAHMKKALAKAEFVQRSYDVLLNIMKHGKERARIAAVKELSVQLGERQPDGPAVAVKIENIIQRGKQESGEVIDVEVKRFPGM